MQKDTILRPEIPDINLFRPGMTKEMISVILRPYHSSKQNNYTISLSQRKYVSLCP
jgi:hypothetical protein